MKDKDRPEKKILTMSDLNADIELNLSQNSPLLTSAITREEALRSQHQSAHLLDKLKSFCRDGSFKECNEEIHFFREIKPTVLSSYLFWRSIVRIVIAEPIRSTEAMMAQQALVLREQRRLCKKYISFYSYHLSEQTNRDQQYYTRSHSIYKGVYRDDTWSTGYDTVLSRLKANELLIKQIPSLIINTSPSSSIPSTLAWTGSKTDLIELIYSLQYSKAINDGSVDIRSIAEPFSQLFNIELGDYYRTFQDIRIRKSGQANFLDKLKERFIKRIQESER